MNRRTFLKSTGAGLIGLNSVFADDGALLQLLGVNHEKLTFQDGGRNLRLTDVHGQVVKDILA